MINFKKNAHTFLASKSIGNYIALGVGVAALAVNVAYVIATAGDIVFSIAAFVLTFVGIAVQIGAVFAGAAFMQLIVVGLYAAGYAFVVASAIPTITDILNGVVFIGGNQTCAVVFLILFSVVAILGVVPCFLVREKSCRLDGMKETE